ncbi:MAG: hypothetical protein LBH24_05500 [Clostridiales bacterium]|jgi:predicted  nucleic acid-binding Zn-ribbon protein|nr:hypothetical protein [Clostridiales bacterium]
MKLNELLAYQKADIELKRLQRGIDKSEQSKEVYFHKREFAAAKKMLADTEAMADEIVARYSETLSAFEDSYKRVEKLSKELDGETDEAREGEILAMLESLHARLGELERRIFDLKKRSEKALAEFSEAQKRGKYHKEAFGKAKEAYDKYAAGFAPQLESLKKEIETLRKAVDKESLAVYDALSEEKILPAFVPLTEVDKSYVCSGCGMQLAGAARADLDQNGCCRCESCRRMIFKK